MNLLLDTQILIWNALCPERLSERAVALFEDSSNELFFSAASIWEIAIKDDLGRPDFRADARIIRRELIDHSYGEVAITGTHAAAVALLPPIHKDPFDRIMIAQSAVEEMTFVTADATVARYPGSIHFVRRRS